MVVRVGPLLNSSGVANAFAEISIAPRKPAHFIIFSRMVSRVIGAPKPTKVQQKIDDWHQSRVYLYPDKN